MSRTERVGIRVTPQQKKIIKKYGDNFSHIFELGYERFIENLPDELEKKANYYQKLYVQCVNKINESEKIISKNMSIVDQVVHDYTKTGRSLIKPTKQDINWLKGRCEKHHISLDTILEKLQTGGL